MPTIFDHISVKSKTAIRKTLRTSLEGQFAQVKALVDELCDKMYARIIPHEECKVLYEDLIRLLREIENTFTNYAESRKCTIGIDDEGDISFMKKLLEEYKPQINQLEKGIEEAKQHEYRFEAQERKQQSIKILESLSSYNRAIECQLDNLQRQYNELESDVYGPQSDEVVLNRFNQQFYDVNQSLESSILEALSKVPSGIFSIFGDSAIDSLVSKVLVPIRTNKRKVSKQFIRNAQIELFKPLWNFLDGKLIELYDKPQELARLIYEKKLDNKLVEDMMVRLCLWKLLDDACVAQSEEDFCKRRRGRPTVDKFYEQHLDLDRLGEFIRETFSELYGSSIEEDIKRKGKKCYLFLSILLIALNGGSPQRVMGKIACFCRYVKKTFGLLGRSLRSFQMYISGTIKFLHNRLKSAEGDEEAMKDSALKTGTRKFYEGMKLLSGYFNKTPIFVRDAIEVGSIKRPRMTYFLSLN